MPWIAAYEESRSALDMGPERRAWCGRACPRPLLSLGGPRGARRDCAGDGFAADLPVGEDVNFVWRLAERGWQVRYEPAAAVAHAHRVQLGRGCGRRRDYGTSAAPLELRHPGTVPAVSMSGWSAAAWVAAAACYPGVGAGITGTATALLARRLAPVTDGAWPLACLAARRPRTLAAGRVLGSALSRAWWPVARCPPRSGCGGFGSRWPSLVLAPPALGWLERRPPTDPAGRRRRPAAR